jgi:hypothetical protein
LRQRFEVFAAHHRMLAGYRPGPAVRAPTVIVSASDSPNARAAARWPRVLRGPVTTLRLASDHYAFLRPPLVADIAGSILTAHRDPAPRPGPAMPPDSTPHGDPP